MNDTEREAIILNNAWEMIDGMVNWAMFEKTEKVELSNLFMPTAQHHQLFLILLTDFLSQTTKRNGKPIPLGLSEPPSGTTPANRTFLFHLRQVCANPILGNDSNGLSDAVEAFAVWLEKEFVSQGVNLHTADVVLDLRVSRYTYIKICGDIAKHNLSRLEGNGKRLGNLIASNGVNLDEQQIYLAFETFYEWFAEGIFVYHISQIAELLNNIRWAIYEYLVPEYNRSWHERFDVPKHFQAYSYHVPDTIKEPIAIAMYWSAMNRVRSRPYFQRFVIPEIYKTAH
jgi:hypothetical protein